MKQNRWFLRVLSFALLLSFIACKKDNHSATEKDDPEVSVHSDDELFFTSEIDGVFYDANLLLEAGSVSARHQDNIICDATIAVDQLSNPQTITITYDGAGCIGTRSREGVVVLSAPQGMQWKNAGAAVKVEFKDLKITRKSDKKSIAINGEQTYTNTSGGLLLKLATLESITHTVTSSGLSVTFNNGSKRNWQVAQQRVFTYDNGIVVAVSGTHAEGNNTQVAVWGTNRFGAAFTSAITDPLVIRQDCNFRLTGGAVKHTVGSATATAVFGLDASGNPVSCPSGNYYYKLVWTGPNGNSITAMVAY
ncbi:hypothetical protein [Agriterribacter sp.]|uniref:hypothetical protein n=1 Tax=Agriterribacter sp. TaxID=2821509 RepID=UPI002CB49DEF|nr:hypothetical protein [Agriterribacter sp.]HRO45461.1 hypothetical protein [Agriterribacter sp.]HRQ19178.1 hypothetical protein [Agriterribacter sp.]